MIPFAKELAAGQVFPIYVLVSPEPLLLSRAVAAIRDAAVPESMRAWNYQAFDGRGGKAIEIRSAAQTLPMMGEWRMVLVRGAHQLVAAELAGLVSYLADPNPRATLVLTAPKVDKRIKFFAAARKAKVFWELAAPRRLGGWIEAEAKSRDIRIDRQGARRLLDVIGKDVSRLSVALDQLALYAGDAPVTAEHVDELIANTRESSVFELTDAVGAGDRAGALTAIASLADQRQSTLGVVMMMARHVRQLCLAREILDSGGGRGLASALKVPPFVADKLAGQAKRYDTTRLLAGLAKLSEADRACKGMAPRMRTLGKTLGERLLLEELADELIALGSATRRSV